MGKAKGETPGVEAKPVDARIAAARVVTRVLKEKAFAAAALEAELQRSPDMSQRDRALATELVYGVLRTRAALLAELKRFAKKGVAKGDAELEAHFLIGAYQLLLLDRVPAHAAVNGAVRAVKRLRGPRVAGFANAVLRKLKDTRLERDEAVVASTPGWLRAALAEAVGESSMRALLVPDDVGLTIRTPEPHRDISWLETTPGDQSPYARHLLRGGDPRRDARFASERYAIQEEGSQVVALALGARPGERILDACAGRGQKSHLIALAEPLAHVHSCDLYPAKLSALTDGAQALGLDIARTTAVDWTGGVADVPDGFDRALVDAPCTGTGTLRHRPEIALRLNEDAPERLASLSETILRRVVGRVRIGGRIVFAVCSVLPRECEQVVERLANVLRPVEFDADLPALRGQTSIRLLPSSHGTDGYFIASLTRIS